MVLAVATLKVKFSPDDAEGISTRAHDGGSMGANIFLEWLHK